MFFSNSRSMKDIFCGFQRKVSGVSPAFSRRCRVESLEHRHLLSAVPTLEPIADVTMGSGTAYYLKLDATDSDVMPDGSGEQLTFSADVTDATLVTEIPDDANNRSLRLNIDSPGNSVTGVMEFQLFEEIAPRTTGHITSLVESDFYNGITFHRVINEFMIQTGDPTATGSGGSDLGEFDDEFSPLQMHTVPGILSMAKSNDDTNDSQFFITEVPTRWLDFNHSVFGYLTDGEDVREAISGVLTDDDDMPVYDVTITSAEVFTDYEDGVLILQAPEGFTGNVDVTITVDDGNGGTAQQTFTVTVEADTEASNPYLGEIDPIEVTAGSSATVTLPALDVDGGDLYFDAQIWPENADITFSMDNATGELTVNVAEGVGGIHSIFVGVRQDDGSDWDTQLVPLFIEPGAPPTYISVASDPGDPVELLVEGTYENAEVWIYEGEQLVGQATSQGETVTVADTYGLSDGIHLLQAKHSYTETSTVGNNDYTETFESPIMGEYLVVIGDVTPQLTITTLDDTIDLDDGEISLREALAYTTVSGDDTITFDETLFASGPAVLTLQKGEIGLRYADDGAITIEGPGADLLTIDAGGTGRICSVVADVVAGFSGMTMTGGSATDGGAVLNDSGTIALDRVILLENLADYGGAVYNYAGTLTISNSTIRANSAEYGGGILNDAGTAVLNNVRFEGNSATQGGGFFDYQGQTTVNNGVFVGNTAQYGGGLLNNAGTVSMNNCTVASNAVTGSGGGVLTSNGTLTVTNSIIALNSADSSLPNLYGTLSQDSGYNLIDGSPAFTATPYPGSDGEWGTSDDDYGDLSLIAGSSTIDAGSNALLPADVADLDGDGDTAEPLPVDVDGNARVSGGTVDIGAYEFTVAGLEGDLNGDGSVGGSDLDIVRANWGQQVTPGDLLHGDASGDGVVNGSDLDIIRANWGQTAAAASASADSNTDAHPSATEDNTQSAQRDTRALADAAWAREVEALRAKTRKKATAAAVDWLMMQR